MSQINLLNQNNKPKASSDGILSAVAGLLGFVFFLIMLGFLGLHIYGYYLSNEVASLKEKLRSDQNNPNIKRDRDEVLTRQGQIKEAVKILDQQSDWSQVLQSLAKNTLKGSTYQNVVVSADGKVRFSISVKNYAQLDKFLTALSEKATSGEFSNPRVISIGKSTGDDGLEVSSTIEVNYKKIPKSVKSNNGSVKGVMIEEDPNIDYKNYQITE